MGDALDDTELAEYLQTGQEGEQSGRWLEALRAFEGALSLAPENLQALLGRTSALLHLGKSQEAVIAAEQAVQLLPDKLLRIDFASALLQAGERGRAQEQIAQGVGDGEGSAHMFAYASLISGAMGNVEEAESYARQAAIACWDDPYVQYAEAKVRKAKGMTREAERSLYHALALDPYYVDAVLMLHELLWSKGQHDEAIRLLRNALAAMPDNLRLRFALVSALMTAGRYDDGYKLLVAKSSEGEANAHYWHYRAYSALRLRFIDDAYASALKACELNPDSAPYAFYLGECLWSLGRRKEAVAAYRRANSLDPGYKWAARALICSELRRFRLRSALSVLWAYLVAGIPELQKKD